MRRAVLEGSAVFTTGFMKALISASSFIVILLSTALLPINAQVNVTQKKNNVYALDATDGSIIWQRNVGTPVTSGLPCGNISPFGIIGTPVADLASRALFFNAMINGATKKHFVFSLNVDTGATNPGWPVDL